MKTMKRISGLLLALALVLALAVPALAVASDTGCIYIKKNGTTPADNRTFVAYRILNATFSSDGTPVYTLISGQDSFYADLFGAGYSAQTTNEAKRNYVLDQINDKKTASEIENFVELVITTIGNNSHGLPSNEIKDGATNVTKMDGGLKAEGLAHGYYVIVDTTDPIPANSRASAVMADTTSAACVGITLKADTPAIDKKILVGETPEEVTNTEGSIGDVVNYQLVSYIPDMKGFNNYVYNIIDTLSKGLTFQDDVEIKLDGTLVDLSTYEVTPTGGSGADTQVKIVFKDFYDTYKDYIGAGKFVITYSATINEHAVYGNAGNPNSVYLIYSNDPRNEMDGDEPGEDDVPGKTPEVKTFTYVTKVTILKLDRNSRDKLEGAQFKITGTSKDMAHVIGSEFVKDGTGTYWLLKDGSYTTTERTDLTRHLYAEDENVKYKQSPINKVVEIGEGYVDVVGWTNAEGLLTFAGLGDGKYTIEEIVAPDGYNLLEDSIEIEIKWNAPEGDKSAFWSYKLNNSSVETLLEDGTLKFEVENNKGGELPSTGGMGTTLFTIGGIVLMVGAAVVLAIRRRGAKTEK